jgi:hypothetical protein
VRALGAFERLYQRRQQKTTMHFGIAAELADDLDPLMLACQRCPGDRRFARYVRHVQVFQVQRVVYIYVDATTALTDGKTDRYARRYECNEYSHAAGARSGPRRA